MEEGPPLAMQVLVSKTVAMKPGPVACAQGRPPFSTILCKVQYFEFVFAARVALLCVGVAWFPTHSLQRVYGGLVCAGVSPVGY